MKIRSHRIAMAAYATIQKRKDQTESNKSYGALAHKTPALITQNGLAQTTGFFLSKNRNEHRDLLTDIREVFNILGSNFKSNEDFHNAIISADLKTTMSLTREAIEITAVLRRYVQGVLRINSTGGGIE